MSFKDLFFAVIRASIIAVILFFSFSTLINMKRDVEAAIISMGQSSTTTHEFEYSLRSSALQVVTNVGRGSAVVLEKGIALSAEHVCRMFDEAKSVELVDMFGNKMPVEFYEVPKRVKGRPHVDICVIKFTPKTTHPTVKLSKDNVLVLGTILFNPNYGGGKYYSFRTGVVISEETVDVPTAECFPPFIPCTEFDIYPIRRTTVPGIPGASGSGLFNRAGELVGILVIGGAYGEWSGVVPLEQLKGWLGANSKIIELAGISVN